MTRTILVPLDFSACSPGLMGQAIRFATAFDAELTLLHVAEPPKGLPLGIFVHPPGASAPVSVETWLRQDSESHLEGLRNAALAAGVPVKSKVVFGRIADSILAEAAAADVFMVVMGTHGRTGLTRTVLGSVAEEVIRHADVPVVTVRAQHRPECTARSCATCAGDRTEVEELLRAEADG